MTDVAAEDVSRRRSPSWLAHWPLILGFAIMAAPTINLLGKQVWTRESSAHGPIILATGAWLIWRQWPTLSAQAKPAPWAFTALVLLASIALYIFGHSFDFISLETAGLYGAGLGILLSLVGLPSMLKSWFPLFYAGFVVPPPDWFIAQITAPLKQFVSSSATGILSFAGLPIEREGVTIHVAQYQLLVEDACSGMNSLVGLFAISLLYIYLLRGSYLIYSLVLTGIVIPVAIVGNILRIIVLILLTYFFGDQVAQGFAHFAAGIFLFGVDLLMVFAIDSVLFRVIPASWRAR
jgi:exosortase